VGSCIAVSGTPVGARPACVGVGTSCGGTCDGATRTSCAYPGASTACDDGAFCTVSDSCNGAGACAPGVGRLCSDGLGCTVDACNEDLDSCVSVLAGGCVIDGACVAEGTRNPTNECLACVPSVSTTGWTAVAAGTVCDDGLFCTVGDSCDASGTCGGVARDCGDGVDCTLDVCNEETASCESRVVDTCQIDGACIPATTRNPLNPCEVCDPDRSTATWSPAVAGTACDDGAFCTDGDECDGAGTCGGAPRVCDDDLSCTEDTCDDVVDACTHELTTGCLVGGTCVAEGAASPSDECLVCDSSVSTSAYTPSDAPACRPDGGRPDGGRPDAGRPDAGSPDAGAPQGDAGTPDNFGVAGGGCGCRATEPSSSGSALGVLGLLVVGLLLRRRRR
jgi:MYXO-CTERM domain-containing protein